MKIGILGGTFDPPTKAHMAIAQLVQKSGITDKVWLTPTYNSNHKKPHMRFWSRMVMCNKAILDIDKKDKNIKTRIWTSDIESDFPDENSTYDLIIRLRDKFPDDKFYMIIGMDQAINIKNWYKWENLIKEVPFIVISRGKNYNKPDYWFNSSPHIYINAPTIPNISSSMYRELAPENTYDNLSHIISPGVYKFTKNFYNSKK